MKKLTLLLIGLLISLVSYSQVYKSYTFSKPTLTQVGNYTSITQNVCLSYGKEGYPELPYYPVIMNNITSISIDSISYYPIINNITVIPKQKEYIDISLYNGFTLPNDAVYYTKKFPNNIVEVSKNSFTICPVVYYPSRSQIQPIKYIRLKINTVKPKSMLSPMITTTTYDLLLITKEEFISSFDRYMKYKESQGYYVKVVSTESIYSTYSGIDKQEKIRNCIKYYKSNNNLKYVILGGTSLPSLPSRDVVPHRGMWGNYNPIDTDIPSDIYYSNLEGDWKNLEDTIYGLPGSEDLTTEVFVGRLPIVDIKNINDITDKLIKYQDNPVNNNILNISMVGQSVNINNNLYGSKDMENLIVTGNIPNRFTFYKLYDSLNINNVTDTQVLNLYNNVGINIFNHLGHSSFGVNMGLSTGYYIPRDSRQFIFNDGITKTYSNNYTQGCYAGAFDLRDGTGTYFASEPYNLHCITGAAVVGNNGCVSYISNSRYGFYDYNSNGSSQKYHREFLLSLFDKEKTQIGEAFYDAKSVIAPLIPSPMSGTNIRWTYYTLNLLGDPTMYIWTKIPTDIIATYPLTINTTTSEVTVNTNTSNARVGLILNDKLIGRGITDNNGNVTINIDKSLLTNGTINLSIIASNKNRFRGNINVIINTGTIKGFVSYNNKNNTPMKNVIVQLCSLDNIVRASSTTGIDGIYQFNNVEFGTYKLKVICNNSVGSINSVDAQLVTYHFVDMKKLTGLYLSAADVNNDKVVNAIDSQLIMQYFTGFINIFPSGKWCFEDKTVTLNSFNKIQNVKGLCYGDVNGSYIPN